MEQVPRFIDKIACELGIMLRIFRIVLQDL